MKYLKIKNQGEIEPQALTLMGASSKVNDDNKIGMFGSGNKYALAYFLRNNIQVKIFSGTNEISVETKKEFFREEEFDIVYINNEKTSLTTKMGKDWKLWHAIREIYCNAIDEENYSIDVVDSISPVENETHFYLEVNDNVNEIVQSFDNFFSQNKSIVEKTNFGEVLTKTNNVTSIYRKGIRCFDHRLKSIYDYNFYDIQINESRVVPYNWIVIERLWKLLSSSKDEKVIKDMFSIMHNKDYIESMNDGCATFYMNFASDVFKNFIAENKFAPVEWSGLLKKEEINLYYLIPNNVYVVISSYMKEENKASIFKDKIKGHHYVAAELNKLQQAIFDRAIEFFRECEYEINYPIEVVNFNDKNVLGLAHDGKIYISTIALERGIQDTCNTIIEENIHLKYGVSDETRGFQDAAINEMIGVMKKAYSFAI